ncbi:MAG: PTS glucose/sucrose transporter subunit IIB [Flavobacteriales bacterium]|nr:PTS glucose/sucrose transporter subunit IIB [Flavobacteriales bacterium]
MKHFDLSTPGRGGNTKLFTKKDFKAAKAGEVEPQILAIIDAYGGKNNIVKTANCATRLRYDVKNVKLVSEDKLKAAGAMGVMFTSKTHVQAIMGTKAEVINGKVNKALPNVKATGTVKQTAAEANKDKKLTTKK